MESRRRTWTKSEMKPAGTGVGFPRPFTAVSGASTSRKRIYPVVSVPGTKVAWGTMLARRGRMRDAVPHARSFTVDGCYWSSKTKNVQFKGVYLLNGTSVFSTSKITRKTSKCVYENQKKKKNWRQSKVNTRLGYEMKIIKT